MILAKQNKQNRLKNIKMTYSEISKIIYVSDTNNPPLPDRTTDAEIIIKNSKNISFNDWARSGHISQYTLKITEPKSLGLTTQHSIEGFFDDVILSCNLLMIYGAIRIHGTNMSKFQIEYEKVKPKPPITEKDGSTTKIIFSETVRITDSYMLGCSFKEEIDENEIKKILKIIQNIDSSQSNLKLNDLKKSLEMYRTAISGLDRLTIFRNLFSATELACNCDGNDRNSIELSQNISSITGEDESNIEEWRKFNARLKHIDTSSIHEQTYKDGMNKLPSWIAPLRRTTQKIIISHLNSLSIS